MGRHDAQRLWATATIDRKISGMEEAIRNLFAGIRSYLLCRSDIKDWLVYRNGGNSKCELSDHLVFECVSQKLSVSCDVKRLHHSVFVKGDRAWFYVDHTRDLLHRQSPCEQL